MAVLNDAGAMIANSEKRYMPFGDVRTDLTISNQTDYGYTGQREIEESDLVDYNARFLNPGLARFTQPDTIIQSISNPQTLNRYSYVNNNPIRYTVPPGILLRMISTQENLLLIITLVTHRYIRNAMGIQGRTAVKIW